MKNPRVRASSSRRSRRAGERSAPVGFWQDSCSATSLISWRARIRSSASMSAPSASTGSGRMRAPGRLQRGERAGERRRLDDGDVAGAEHGARDEVDPLARAGRDEDLVGARREADLAADLGEPLAQLGQALDLQVVGDRARRVAPDLRRELGELLRGAQRGVGIARAERDRVAGERRVQRVAQHVVGVRRRPHGEHAELPVVVDGRAGAARAAPSSRRHGHALAHERPAPDRRRDVAQLGQPAVHAHRGQVVDRHVGGDRAGRRKALAGGQLAAVDERRKQRDELLRDRDLAVAFEVKHLQLV